MLSQTDDRRKPKIMIFGLGDLGATCLELFVRDPFLNRVTVCSRDSERGLARCNLARLSSIAQSSNAEVDFVRTDLNDIEATAETIHRVAPDVILNTASLQSWWTPYSLGGPVSSKIKAAGFGAWLPVHMTLALKWMKAVRLANYPGITLSAPFPDVVNCVLGRLGLAPTGGVGNIEEIVPKVRWLAAGHLDVSLDDISVYLIAHHAIQKFVFSTAEASAERPPYFLRIERSGVDVTDDGPSEKWLFSRFPLPPGLAIHFLTAACTVRLIHALFVNHGMSIHVAGPDGLPGGYPVVFKGDRFELAAIEGLSREQAIMINERSHRFDGIQSIEEDGSVIFCDDTVSILKEVLGYDCPRLRPDEIESRAQELLERFELLVAASPQI